VVNVFASWCGPCRLEHPQLLELAGDDRIRLVGINYKDVTANAVRFLDELGNPYAAIGVDDRGRAAIDWGVYGVPETFIVDADGVIRYKHIGPIDADALDSTIRPAIDAVLKPAG
jgi:cytochrome c biogenesis protein CcmG/thiol:disulfide interchange protein DsbE